MKLGGCIVGQALGIVDFNRLLRNTVQAMHIFFMGMRNL